MYDVTIIGCGITGSACAYYLSKYRLRIAVLEKKNDVCCSSTRANSAIIHAGYDPEEGSPSAKYNVRGAELAEEICKRLDVPYKKIGSLVVAFSEGERKTIEELYKRGKNNGVPGLRIIEKDELKETEPYISDDAVCALLAPSAAIVNPWEYGLAMAETAVKNGVRLFLNTEVKAIESGSEKYMVKTNSGDFETRFVINAAGLWSDDIHNMVSEPSFEIEPTAGEYYLLDKTEGFRARHVIFQCPNELGKGILVTPTVDGNLLVGPNAIKSEKDDTSTKASSLDFIRQQAARSIPSISYRENIRNFTGVRANNSTGDFIIGFAKKNFLDLAGIKSPGLSSAPAIAEDVLRMLNESGLELEEKENYTDERRHIRFKELSPKEKNELIKKNSAYGRVICRCETITEGEILDALSSPITPVSLDGIKRRAGTGMGRCQGGFCGPKIVSIIAKAQGKTYEDVLQDNDGSYILTGETKIKGSV